MMLLWSKNEMGNEGCQKSSGQGIWKSAIVCLLRQRVLMSTAPGHAVRMQEGFSFWTH